MVFNKKIVDDFLNVIFPLPENFGLTFDNCDDDFEEEYDMINKLETVDPDVILNYGMSKLVICSPKINDVVIKIPFNGFYMNHYNEEGFFEYSEWCPFCFAAGADSSDYCLAEYGKYQQLKNYDLDCFVAKTIFYKEINNVKIFIQEKVNPELELYELPTPSNKSKQLATKLKRDKRIHSINIDWIANCLDYYGESKVNHFFDYCNNVDLDILADAHDANYGYRLDGSPAILDFSNYMD